jgi:uncharacterized repeat protein (TIGR01451 family)
MSGLGVFAAAVVRGPLCRGSLTIGLAIGCMLVLASSAAAETLEAPWAGTGPGTVIVTSNGTVPPAQMTYKLNPAGFETREWKFSTTAGSRGRRNLKYEYEGLHAYASVTVFLRGFVTHNSVTTYTPLVMEGPVSCCTSPSNGFKYVGKVALNVESGDTYGFVFGGSNYDSDNKLEGKLTISVPPIADVELRKNAAPSQAEPGQAVEFTLDALDNGPNDAHSVTLTDTLPTGLVLQAYEPSQGSCVVIGARLECNLGTLSAGAGALVVVRAVAEADAKGSLTNAAALSSETPDSDPANNAASATVTVHPAKPPPSESGTPPPGSDLVVEKHADQAVGRVGEPLTFTVTVKNEGAAKSGPVLLSDVASRRLRVLRAKSASGACMGRRPVVCHLRPIAAKRSATVHVTVVPQLEGTLANAAAATGNLEIIGQPVAEVLAHVSNLQVTRVRILARRTQVASRPPRRSPPPVTG